MNDKLFFLATIVVVVVGIALTALPDFLARHKDKNK